MDPTDNHDGFQFALPSSASDTHTLNAGHDSSFSDHLKPCRLLELPYEIRANILRSCLMVDRPMTLQHFSLVERSLRAPLRTCRQLRYEGIPILFGDNTFNIISWAELPPSHVRKYIRHLSLDLYAQTIPQNWLQPLVIFEQQGFTKLSTSDLQIHKAGLSLCYDILKYDLPPPKAELPRLLKRKLKHALHHELKTSDINMRMLALQGNQLLFPGVQDGNGGAPVNEWGSVSWGGRLINYAPGPTPLSLVLASGPRSDSWLNIARLLYEQSDSDDDEDFPDKYADAALDDDDNAWLAGFDYDNEEADADDLDDTESDSGIGANMDPLVLDAQLRRYYSELQSRREVFLGNIANFLQNNPVKLKQARVFGVDEAAKKAIEAAVVYR